MENQKNKQKFIKLMLVFILTATQIFAGSGNGMGRMEVSAAAAPKLAVTNLSLSVGQTYRLKVANADQVQWSSSKKSVATVSSKGLVRAKKAGRTTITAAVGSKKLKCYVVVNDPSAQEKNILIAFFSQTETTTAVAKQIQELTGGDLLRIRPQTAYTSNYDRLLQIAQRELKDNTRPAVRALAKNMDSYDVIYIGYPIWLGNAPRVINTFLEQYDFTGKTVIPFCTSGGSTIDESIADLKKSCKGAEWKDGYTANTSDGEEIQKWLTEIGELETEEENMENSKTDVPGKILVAYFSATNTTKGVAEHIADGLNADLYEIVPEEPYTDADLNYNDNKSRTSIEMNDSAARPAILGSVENMEQYSIVFIGYPIWWGQAPRIMNTFVESYDFSGKTIVPFCTSGSSGVGSSARNLEALTDGATWLSGTRLNGGSSRGTIIDWVNGLGLDITAE